MSICPMSKFAQHFVSMKLLNKSRYSTSSIYTVFQNTLGQVFNQKRYKTCRTVPDSIEAPPYIVTGNVTCPSAIDIKTKQQIEEMRPSCELAASLLRYVGVHIEAGMSTDYIDAMVHKKCIEAGAYPSPLHYKGFPKSVCTSVNSVACHGIPGPLLLQHGDIINVDITVFYQGYHGDTSSTFIIGNTDESAQRLVKCAQDCLDVGINVCKDGALFSDIGEVIYAKAEEEGFEVIPYFCGHGIGQYFHGPPEIVHVPSDYGPQGKMKAGMTFTVEPIICEGSPEITILKDNWTAVTKDNGRSAQFEHTIVVTKDGYEILTK